MNCIRQQIQRQAAAAADQKYSIRRKTPNQKPHVSSLHVGLFIAGDHNPIHPLRIAINVLTATIAHKITPCKSGRAPTCLIVAFDNPVPIKNKVTVNPMRPSLYSTGYAGPKDGK